MEGLGREPGWSGAKGARAMFDQAAWFRGWEPSWAVGKRL